VGPWAAFVLWSSWPQVAASVGSLEKFPETFNPGYFLIKIALALLVLLVLVDARDGDSGTRGRASRHALSAAQCPAKGV
jgi:hypothetical protein